MISASTVATAPQARSLRLPTPVHSAWLVNTATRRQATYALSVPLATTNSTRARASADYALKDPIVLIHPVCLNFVPTVHTVLMAV